MEFYAVLAAAVASEGVKTAFGLISHSSYAFVDRLTRDHGVAYFNSRGEAGAVGMADGYSRATDELGVVTVAHGPGFTNAITQLVTAQRGRVPMLLLMGDASQVNPMKKPFTAVVQHLDPGGILDSLDIPYSRLEPSSIWTQVHAAVAHAKERRTPYVLLVPDESLEDEVVSDGPLEGVGDPTEPAIAVPGRQALEDAAALLYHSNRVVVLAGRGVAESHSEDLARAIAQQVGGVLATTLGAIGLFEGDPFNIGVAGSFSTGAASELFATADCILALGASLNPLTTFQGELFSGARVIHCDTDPRAIGRFHKVDVPIVGDVGLTLQALAGLLSELGLKERQGLRTESTARAIASASMSERILPARDSTRLDPQALSRALDSGLPRPRQFIVDDGMYNKYPVRFFSVGESSKMDFVADFGAMGGAFGAGLGAAIGRPDLLTCYVVGDGGFALGLAELDTIARYQIPVLVVVYNDRSYGAEVRIADRMGLSADLARFTSPSPEDVARGFGLRASTVATEDDLEALAASLCDLPLPHVLNCEIATLFPDY